MREFDVRLAGTGWPMGRLLALASLLLTAALLGLSHHFGIGGTGLHRAAALASAGAAVMVTFFAVWRYAFGHTNLGQIQGAAQTMTVIASALGPVLFAECEAQDWVLRPVLGRRGDRLGSLGFGSGLFAFPVGMRKRPYIDRHSRELVGDAHPYCVGCAMKARQAVIAEPFRVGVREVDLPDPGPEQVLVRTEASFVSPGTELAVYTGTHQWLQDPSLPDWKFPFRPGYSAAGEVVAVGAKSKVGNGATACRIPATTHPPSC